jgi:hypothetical protein
MPDAPNLETITGTISYQGAFASIKESNNAQSLLIIDSPPLGQYNQQEAAQAASFLRDFMGVQPGAKITLQGFRDAVQTPAGARPVILIVRVF